MSDKHEYFNYLTHRSNLALFYRNYWLYPKINSFLSGRVLDVGCGLGDFIAYRSKDTVGTDIIPESVSFCRARGVEAHVMTEGSIPFSTGEFDGVVLDNVLEHINKPQNLLIEINRVLKPLGVLIIGVPGPKGFASDPDHKVYYDQEQLINTISPLGFKFKLAFTTPINWSWLKNSTRHFCLYAIFTRA